jgi:hypothetical protein
MTLALVSYLITGESYCKPNILRSARFFCYMMGLKG